MALHWNEVEITEAIKEAKAHCAATTQDVEALSTADIRKAESCGVEHAHSIQHLHAEDMQCLEMDTMEEEGRACLSFLATCGMAL